MEQLWSVPVVEARRRLGLPEGGVARELYREITMDPEFAAAFRQEWRKLGIER